jgi:HD superfamily phosphohydrolase
MIEEKVFKDPVHKYIYVQDQIIWDLINTKEFQRLRRIRQLGTSYLTFHGAEHSRFSHSLGVYEMTRKIISQFERNQYEDWPKEERILCLCAALLHDIGHGPFSHSVEKVFGTHHEDWTVQLLLGDTEVNHILRQITPDFPQLVAQVICKTYPQNIVISLVSSQLDADRMDYLLRDAYFTGVNYGTFDIERILRVLRPYQGRIVVKESGMHAVEDYLMSRYQMYWQVYFHPVTRSAEIILLQIFRRVKVLYENKYGFQFMLPQIIKLCENQMTIHDYLELDESIMQATISFWCKEQDEILADLCHRFLHRKLFQYLKIENPSETQMLKITEIAIEMGYDPSYYVHIDQSSNHSYDVYQPGREDDSLPILLLHEDKGELMEISKQSNIIRSISGTHGGKPHIYFPEACMSRVMKEGLC